MVSRALTRLSLAAAAVLIVGACGGKKAPEQPAPAPAPAPAPSPAQTLPAPAPVQPQPTVDPNAEAARVTALVLTEVRNMVHFDYNESSIRAEDRSLLDAKAAILGVNTALRLRISGHADDRGSDEYNLALGNRRAAAVKTYLTNKGIDGSRLEVISYGEERPIANGQDETSWFQNRRAEFEVTAGGQTLRNP
jgi:peptidoglycan-associated lipoprotein